MKIKSRSSSSPAHLRIIASSMIACALFAFGAVNTGALAAGNDSKPITTAAIDQNFADDEPNKSPLGGQDEEGELNFLREQFKSTVQAPTIDRLNRIIKRNPSSTNLQQILDERIKRVTQLSQAYVERLRQDILKRTNQGKDFGGLSQYFVYADVNPKMQMIFVCFFDAKNHKVEIIGADLISSGELSKGFDYYVTPTGVFENLVENFSYRALGTPNQEGWRGLGPKGSRVWDFGYQKSLKTYKGSLTKSEMRLLLHATDPVQGEVRLGRADSKGCVRISQGLNHYLDKFAILDFNYEAWLKSKKKSWLLDNGRSPVKYPGKYLIIGDSSVPSS